MHEITSSLTQLAQLFSGRLHLCSLALTTSLVALYGTQINRFIQRQLRQYPLFIRTAAFIFICAFGYGWLGAKLAQWLQYGLERMPTVYLAPTLISLFICLGLLAQRERYI